MVAVTKKELGESRAENLSIKERIGRRFKDDKLEKEKNS